MKNTKLILTTIIISFLLYLGFEISAGKINFGTAWWSDTLSNRITTNKSINLRPGDSLYYNGNVVTSGTGTNIDTNKYLSIYRLDTSKLGFLNQGNQWTEMNEYENITVTNSLENIGQTVLMEVTISGIATFGDDIEPQWVKNHSPHSELSYTKEKVLKFKAPAANSSVTLAHGVTDWHSIVFYQVSIKDDTTNVLVHEGGWYTPWGFYTKVDTTNITVTIPSTSYSIANDSGYVYLIYVDPNR